MGEGFGMRDALMRLLEPPVEALGFELLEIEFAQAGRGGVLRIYIDRGAGADSCAGGDGCATGDPGARVDRGAAGGGGARRAADGAAQVTVDDCAAVSHAVSQVLEMEDPIKGHYTLEVSSPGFDRILRKRAHFERFLGARVAAEMKVPIDGRRRFVGTLKSIDGDSIVIEVDGRPHGLPLERIQKARLRPE
jgi:ribosome maturation factor RimP